ncbi:MAG: sulfite oxidase-like oxidoreductase [Cyanobacteria bacterium P01_H01_bin.15]
MAVGKFFHRPNSEQQERVPPGQHLAKGFPVLTYGDTPQISLDSWTFNVWGLVEAQQFRWAEFMSLPQSTFTVDFHCVTRWSKLDLNWRGIAISHLLEQLSIPEAVTHVLQHCYGGYTTNISLADLQRADCFFAFGLEGETLSPEHGGPLRTILPHLYAWKSAKWINGFEFLSVDEPGFWERNGYHHRGDPWQQERYAVR